VCVCVCVCVCGVWCVCVCVCYTYLHVKHNDAGHRTDCFISPKTYCLVLLDDGQDWALK